MNLEFQVLESRTGDQEAELDTKSIDAFRTISEVADDLDIPQHVLRFWETRFSQIKPLKRGGGRRYYRPDDVALLKGIRRLLYGEGYTIKGLQRILKEQGARHVQAIGRGAPVAPPAGERPVAAAAATSGRADAAEALAAGGSLASSRSGGDPALLAALLSELGTCRSILAAALRREPAIDGQ